MGFLFNTYGNLQHMLLISNKYFTMVRKGCEKNQSKFDKQMACNTKVAHVGNQQNVFESPQYFQEISSGTGAHRCQSPGFTQMGHSKYPTNEQFYQMSGPVSSSQSRPGTMQNLQHGPSHQYKSQNYCASATQTVFQQVRYPTRVLKEASANQKYNGLTNEMLLKCTRKQNYYMPAYEYNASALPQSINGQFSCQPTAAYQKVQGPVPFADGEVSRTKSVQNSNLQVLPPYSVHLGTPMTYNVHSEWPPNLSSDLSAQTFNLNSVLHQHGETLTKQMESQPPGHVHLPEEVLKLLQPKPFHKNADVNVQNQPRFYSDAQNAYYDGHHRPQNTSTENGCNNDVLSSYESRNTNCNVSFNPKDTGSYVSSQPSTGLLQRVLRYGPEYSTTSAPASIQNPHAGSVPGQGNYSADGSTNSMGHSLNSPEKSVGSHEAIVKLHRQVSGTNDDYIDALLNYKEKSEIFKSVHSNGSLPASNVHKSKVSENVCGNGPDGNNWQVAPHVATNRQISEVLPCYKTALQQNMQLQSYTSPEENYVNQTSMGTPERMYSSPTLDAHCARDQNEPTSYQFSNYLINNYQPLDFKKSRGSAEKTNSLGFNEGIQSDQSSKQCALSSRLPASVIEPQTSIKVSCHPNICNVPDRNGILMEQESLTERSLTDKYGEREQTCNPRQNDTSDQVNYLCSPNSKPLTSESVQRTMASQLKMEETVSLPTDMAVKQEPSDGIQHQCKKMDSSTDDTDEQQASRDADPKRTLSSLTLCVQNDAGVLNKSQKAVCLIKKASTTSIIDVSKPCSDRATIGHRSELFGINLKKTAEPQIAVVNPLILSKSESPSKDQENVPPGNGVYHTTPETLRGLLSQQRKRKLADVLAKGNIDNLSSVNILHDILDSDATVNCPGSKKMPMVCALNSRIGVPQHKAKKSAPALNTTNLSLQLESNKPIPPQVRPLCQEETPELQLGDGALLLVNGACEQQFQISSVCTLVEGSTFYDSQIAKIFDADSLVHSKDKTCEMEVQCFEDLEAPSEQPHLDPSCKRENQSNSTEICNGSDQVLVSSAEPEQTSLKTLSEIKETVIELRKTDEDGTSFNPITSEQDTVCCTNKGPIAERVQDMTENLQEERTEGNESSSESYLNSQLSELLKMFPFGIDTMETGALSEENGILEKDQVGSDFAQLREHQPDKVRTVTSPVVGQTKPKKQADIEKGLQFTDCSIRSPDITAPENRDAVHKEKGKPKSKEIDLVSELENDRTVYSMKVCSPVEKGFINNGFSVQGPIALQVNNNKYTEIAKEQTNMTSANCNQNSFNVPVAMETMSPVSSLSVYEGEKIGFYWDSMAIKGRTTSSKHEPANQTTFQLTHQGKNQQNCLPQTGAEWLNTEWINSAKKLNYLPVEHLLYQSSDAIMSGICKSNLEHEWKENKLMIQHVTVPTAGGTQIAYGYQDSIFMEHPRTKEFSFTHSDPKSGHKSQSSKKHREQSLLVGLSKEKKKKTRLIVKTDFLKPKIAKTKKVCHKTPKVCEINLYDNENKVSENDCIKSMLSFDKCNLHGEKLGGRVKVALSGNTSFSMTDRGLMEKQGVKERACGESKNPQAIVHDAVVAEEQLHNFAVQEFFQRRKAEQKTGVKKTQQAWEKHKAQQPVQYRKPSTLLKKFEEGGKRKSKGCLKENFTKQPKTLGAKGRCQPGLDALKRALPNSETNGFESVGQHVLHNSHSAGKSVSSTNITANMGKKAHQKPMESIGENFLTRIAFTGYKNGVIQLVNFEFINCPINTLSPKASKPIVTKNPETSNLQPVAEEQSMLKFKLCSEELLGCHTAGYVSGSAMDLVREDHSLDKEIQNKTGASCSNIPLKKRKVDMTEFQGNIAVPKPTLNQAIFSAKKINRPESQNSKVLFSAFKKLYLEIQSRKVA